MAGVRLQWSNVCQTLSTVPGTSRHSYLARIVIVCWSAWTAMTRYHRLGGLNARRLFYKFWRPDKIKVLAGLIPGEDSLQG